MSSRWMRVVFPALLFSVYGVPLFYPPPATLPAWDAHAGFFGRLFPGVPAWWIVVRLAALASGTALWVYLARSALVPQNPSRQETACAVPTGWRAQTAVGWASALVILSPWAEAFTVSLQLTFVATLLVPSLLLQRLDLRSATYRMRAQLHLLVPAALVVSVWIGSFLVFDFGSLEAAIAVDQWRGFVDALKFAAEGKNFLTDRYDPEFPGLGAVPFLIQAVPLWALNLVPPSLASMQLAHMATAAFSAGALAFLVVGRFGPLAAAVAAAGFLFSPYMHFITTAPTPFLFGPLLTLLLLACWHCFRGSRSQAPLAAAGPVAGLAATHPGLIPIVGFFGLLFLLRLRHTWKSYWVGLACATAGLFAVLVPALPKVFTLADMAQLFGFHGNAAWLDLTLLGQRTILLMAEGRLEDVRNWSDIAVGAFLAPLAHSRLHIRLWGDTIFDPLTSVLFSAGVVTALLTVRRNREARETLGLLLAALAPAFTSPVDRVDIVHAVALPVPVALLAAQGFAVMSSGLLPRHAMWFGAALATLSCFGGTTLTHGVNPRILSASSVALAFESLRSEDGSRVVLLDYPADFSIDVRWLYVGPLSAFGWQRPVGYLRIAEGSVPWEELVANGKDLLMWSPGVEEDFRLTQSLCTEGLHVTLFRVQDRAQLGHVWIARLSSTPWSPNLEKRRWHTVKCGEILQPHS